MTRVRLAVPLDVARLFDSTVTQAQIDADTFITSGDDDDTLLSMIEDAEDEFFAKTDEDLRIGSVGLPGQRETYETVTYDVSGHQAYKRNWSGVSTDYRATERTTGLDHERILPFDPTQGDEAYAYRGLRDSGSQWEDITDERGDTWDILNYQSGQMVFHPVELHRAMLSNRQGVSMGGAGQLREVRIALRYRHGGLGGTRSRPAETNLSAQITDTETGTVAVTDGSTFPSSEEIVVLIDREYLSVEPDPANDEMNILERGVRGTSGASHDADATISYTPPSIRKAVASRAAMQLVSAGRYQDFAPDSEDELSKGDLMDELETTWEMTVDALS